MIRWLRRLLIFWTMRRERRMPQAVDTVHRLSWQQQASVVAAIVQQIDDYLLPRFQSLDAPVLAVVGGSTAPGSRRWSTA